MTSSYHFLLTLTIAVLLLTGYNFMSAAWTPAPSAPPANNTPAPVNVGSTTQAKTGNLSANIFAATTEMRSNRYCDALGGNCFGAGDVSAAGYGMAFGAHTEAQCSAAGGTVHDTGYTKICKFNTASCPAGWTQFENWNTNAGRACVGACGSCAVPAQSFGDSATSCTYFNQGNKSDCSPAAAVACNATVTARGCY